MREDLGVAMANDLFPTIQRTIENLVEDEEAGIPTSRLIAVGTFLVVLSTLFTADAFAARRAPSSHSSHSSHSSSSYHRSHISHTSHRSSYSHGSHSNHSSHGSHTSHSNTASHSNSRFSAAGDMKGADAPSVKKIPTVLAPDVTPPSAPSPGAASTPYIDLDAGTIDATMQTPPNTPEVVWDLQEAQPEQPAAAPEQNIAEIQ